MRIFGLIGKNIGYSFSKDYFTTRFEKNNLTDCIYENFDVQDLSDFHQLIQDNPNLVGLNVTIPYKKSIIPLLDTISKKARQIGAVNVIRITKKRKLIGYNSDYHGFKKSLKPLLQSNHKKALILGTGGSAKAVAFALKELNIGFTFVSRSSQKNAIGYYEINQDIFDSHQIIINCTPLGTNPNIDSFPPIPYNFFTKNHIAFDLTYNPKETQFLKKAKENQTITINGMEMLLFQAEKAWAIWNK